MKQKPPNLIEGFMRELWYLSLAGPTRLELATSGLTEQSILVVCHYIVILSALRSFCVPQNIVPFAFYGYFKWFFKSPK